MGNNSLATGIDVANGYFTANVNAGGEFGANAFRATLRWLEVGVKCGTDTIYTV